MNTNAGPSSLGASGSGTMYAGMDSSAQMLQILGCHNMIPMGLYQNVDKDHVDWGALAQQWIQMREQWTQPVAGFIPSPPPPPSFSDSSEPYPPIKGFDAAESVLPYNAAQPSNMVGTPSEYEEQGEAPMEVEKEDDSAACPSLMLPPSVPGQTVVNPNATAAVANWQAKINQLYQMDHPNESLQLRPQMASVPVNQRGSARAGPSITTESKSSRLHGLMEREIKLSESCPIEPAPPAVNGSKYSYSGASVTMNEAKRKLLPAWIREGLEKMEREKQRQYEREQERKQWEDEQRRQRCVDDETQENWCPVKNTKLPTVSSKFKPEFEVDQPTTSTVQIPLAEVTGTEKAHTEDFFESLSISVRKILTEILMEVTGEAMSSIARETLDKTNKRKGKEAPSAQTKTGSAICVGGLGLGIYGDSDEDDEDDEDDDDQRQLQTDNRQTKEVASKGANSGSDLEQADSTDDDISDSGTVRQLKEKIRRRQREFEPAAREIEQWLATTLQHLKDKHGFEPYGSKQRLFRRPERDERAYDSNDEDRDLEDDDEEARGLPDGRGEPNAKALGADSTSANGYGDAGAKHVGRSSSTRDGETQPVNDILYASQQFGRKRRDKRVSRFSVLQEPRTRGLTTPAVPVATTYKLGAIVPPEPAVSRSRLGEAGGKQLPPDAASKANPMLGQQQRADVGLGMVLRTEETTEDAPAAGDSGSVAAGHALSRYLSSLQAQNVHHGDELHRRAGTASDGRRPERFARDGRVPKAGQTGECPVSPEDVSPEPDADETSTSSPLHRGLIQRKASPRQSDHSTDQRQSHYRHHRDRTEKGVRTADGSGHHRHQRTRYHRDHRNRSRSKSSRSSRSTRSQSSRSRSRSHQREPSASKSQRDPDSSSRHRPRSERGRHHASRSRSHSRSRSRSRSRSSGRLRRSSSSKYSSRRRH